MKTRIFLSVFFVVAFLGATQAQWQGLNEQIFFNPDLNAQLGIGLSDPSAKLEVFQGRIRVTPDPDDDIGLSLIPHGGGAVNFRPFVNLNNHLFLDIDLLPPSTDSSNAVVRFFRQTNTLGSRRLDVMRGDGTGMATARISADDDHSFFNRYGGNVGIGTINPTAKLEIRHNSSVGDPHLELAETDTDDAARMYFINAGSNRRFSITATPGDADPRMSFFYNDGNSSKRLLAIKGEEETVRVNGLLEVDGDLRLRSPNNHAFDLRVTGNGNLRFLRNGGNTALMIDDQTGRVGIGSNVTSIPANVQLAVDGKVKCREVRVTNDGWADFVFDEDYELLSLEEVEQFIEDNHHLPDVPSAEEVLENGTDLGAIDAILLQKIEELTLYMIDLKKENAEMKELVKQFNQELDSFQNTKK